jgi:cellulose synthase/poly-beta-1,6-N-acetylglucosamine synthase-like glycosyltransferase
LHLGLVIAALLSLGYLAVIGVLRRGLARLHSAGAAHGRRFSVVIAARNEEANIGPCLEAVLRQSIEPGRFEVIVVDDRSTDRTAEIVREFSERDPRVRLVQVTDCPAGVSPKKNAVAKGVAQARNEMIACTDADCRVGPQWLATLDRFLADDVGFVQGMVAYQRPPEDQSGFLYVFQALDFMSHGIVAAGAIGAGLPLNGNANNMAYRREAYEAAGGFSGNAGVLLGDDDLLLQSIWRGKRWRVAFAADPAGLVETFAAPTLRSMLAQRARWGSVSVHYGPRQLLMLLAFFLFYCATAAALLAGGLSMTLFIAGWAMLFVKLAGELVMMLPAAALYRRPELLPWLALVSVLHLPMVLVSVLRGVLGRSEWKG